MTISKHYTALIVIRANAYIIIELLLAERGRSELPPHPNDQLDSEAMGL